MIKKGIDYYKLLIIIIAISLMGSAHQDIPINKEHIKKIEKAKELNLEAQVLLKRVDALYIEIEQYDSSNPENNKKIKKIEKEILSSQLKAMELYEVVYLLESSVYVELIPLLKAEYVKNKDSTLIIELLGLKAFDLFFKDDIYKSDTNIFEESEAYQRYINLSNTNSIDTSNIFKKRELISFYIGEKDIEFENQISLSFNQDSQKVSTKDGLLQKNINDINYKDSIELYNQVYNDKSVISTELANTLKTDDNNPGLNTGIVFKVQIAADRVMLSIKKLQSIYQGQKKIDSFEKDGWHKYCVGEFNKFNEANNYRANCDVGDAFVIAFQREIWMDVLAAKKIERR
ncbi:MAG: hypothetical protein PF485_08160 [Bacteroidales bacterium]|jgi:hypothetical protein|nr:hypothetical protein [Bacteroidales bacterium]